MRLIVFLYNIVKNILYKDLLEVKLRNEKPEYAFTATISDNDEECFALINEYPERGRGTRGKQYRCCKSLPSEKETYESYLHKFEKSWTNAKTLPFCNDKQ